jgi:hypothetical protein
MVRFEEMTVGVRRVRGPISDVVDLDRRGARYIAIAFQEAYRDDPALAAGLDPFRDFLELPMVEGVAPLAAWRRGVFAYPVPRGRTVRELVGVFAEEGGGGLRAALELVAAALVPLWDAARSGADRGLRSHGALDPWRLVVDERGHVTVIGYGLPPLDILDFQRDETMLPTGDSLRYCPPERLDAEPEDWRSDLFSLALMAAELCSGKPVYEGSETQILNAVSGCDAPKLLERYPAPLLSVLRQTVSPFADQRPADPRVVIEAARRAAERAPGRTLAELVQEAVPYLSDVEDELPSGIPIVEIVGPPLDEPQRQAAIAQATEAAAQASVTVEAMAALLETVTAQPDEGLTGVVQARGQAQQALDTARGHAERADQAGDAAMQAADAPSAEAQARLALAARQEIATLQASFEGAIAEARRLVEEAQKAAAERREQAVATARRAVAQAEAALTSLLASADGVTLDVDDVEQHVGAAKAAARKVEASRDVGAAERAVERVVAAAKAAEEAAGAALAQARAAVERVASARAALAAAEAAYAAVPIATVAEAVEACRQAAASAGQDPDALDLAVVAAEEAKQLAAAAATEREAVRRRAWLAVTRAEAAGDGEEARRHAELAEQSAEPEAVLEATLRAEAAAEAAVASQSARLRTISSAAEAARAAAQRIVEMGQSWHPDGVAAALAEADAAAQQAAGETSEQRALEAAARAERAADDATVAVRTALHTLALLRERAAAALSEAEAEFGQESGAELELIRKVAAEMVSARQLEPAEKQVRLAERALAALRNAQLAQQRAAAARERARAAVIAAEATGPRDAGGHAFVDAARAAANEAERAQDAARAEEAAKRAEEAAAGAAAHAASLAERDRMLAAARERAGKALVAASEWVDRVDETLIAAVHAAVSACQAATEPGLANAAAERAHHALSAVREAAEDLADRERKLGLLRDEARLSVRQAVNLLDRIDADDVPLVEQARAALRELEHTQDLAVGLACSERLERAVQATRAAAERVAERDRALAVLREEGDRLVAQASAVGPWASPPRALSAAANAVRRSRSSLDSLVDLDKTREMLGSLGKAVERWRAEAAQWREKRDETLASVKARAEAAVARLAETANTSALPSSLQSTGPARSVGQLKLLLEQGRAALGQANAAIGADDEEGAQAAAERAELAATQATLLLERGRRLDAAAERSAAALARVKDLKSAQIDVAPLIKAVAAAKAEVDATSDPDVAWTAAERAELKAAEVEAAVERAATAVARARERADEAMERARLAVEAHPTLVAEPWFEEARAARAEVYAATTAAQVEAAAERAHRIAAAAEAALQVARQADLQAALAAHRDRTAALHQQIRSQLERTGLPLQPVPGEDAVDRELRGHLAEVDALIEPSEDPALAAAAADRAAELAEIVEGLVRRRALSVAQAALQTVERAASQVESLELQLHLEACRMAVSEAEQAESVEQVVAAAATAREAAQEAERTLADEMLAEKDGRLAAARSKAQAAMARVNAMVGGWGHTGPLPAMTEAQQAASRAERTSDPVEAEQAAERAVAAASAAVDALRSAGIEKPLARAEAALREAEAAVGTLAASELRAALARVRAERDQVLEATSAAAAAAAAARAEWAVPAVTEVANRTRVKLARERATREMATLSGLLQSPVLAPYTEAAQAAHVELQTTADPRVAEAALVRLDTAVQAAIGLARELDRRAGVASERARVLAAQQRAAAAGEPGREQHAAITKLAAEAERSADGAAVRQLALKAEELAAQAEAKVAEDRLHQEELERKRLQDEHARAVAQAKEAVTAAEVAAAALGPLPEAAPPEVLAVAERVEQRLEDVRTLAAVVSSLRPPQDIAQAQKTHRHVEQVAAAVTEARQAIASWQQTRNQASTSRAREAVERARTAAAKAKKIRDDLSIGRALRQAERAASSAETALEPGDAEWSAALAIQAAERAQELLESLYREVEAAELVLVAIRPWHDEALAALSHLSGGQAQKLRSRLEDAWSQAERAAQRGEGPVVEQMGEEIRGIADEVTQNRRTSGNLPRPQMPVQAPGQAPPQPPVKAPPPPPPPPPALKALQLPSTLAAPKIPAAGPTLKPGDFDALIEALPDPDEESVPSFPQAVRPPELDDNDEGRTLLMTREQLQQMAQRDDDEDDEDDDDDGGETQIGFENQDTQRPIEDPSVIEALPDPDDTGERRAVPDPRKAVALPKPGPMDDPTVRMSMPKPDENDPTLSGLRITPTPAPPMDARAMDAPAPPRRKPSEDETMVLERPPKKRPSEDKTVVLERPKRPAEDKTVVLDRPKRG